MLDSERANDKKAQKTCQRIGEFESKGPHYLQPFFHKTAMSDKDKSEREQAQQKKALRQEQIKTLMNSGAKNLDDKVASLRAAHHLDKGRIQSALSAMLKSK